jgi:hypothetical protein
MHMMRTSMHLCTIDIMDSTLPAGEADSADE